MSEIKLSYEGLKTVPNQKAYQVLKKREPQSVKDVRLSDVFKEDIFLAAQNLKDTTFKLYMYLISNKDEYVAGLSRQDVINKIGISESSYKRGMKELEEKGYFIYSHQFVDAQDGKLPLYTFYARPWGQIGPIE
jgi:biotin operon repressor